jgi:alpha-N-acetylglucosaminidase
MLNDFGGNNGLWGDLPSLSVGPALSRSNGSSIIGTGLTPEGIWQNAVAFDLMNENSYRAAGVDLSDWLVRYSHRRYGAKSPAAVRLLESAWLALGATAYSGHDGEMVSKDTVTAIPWANWGMAPKVGTESQPPWDKVFGTDSPRTGTPLYNETMFLSAWTAMIGAVAAEPALASTTTMRHDLVDVGRQVLAKYSAKIFRRIAAAITATPTPDPNHTLATDSAQLLALLDDLDTLLASSRGFLLGRWLADAEAWGVTPDEKKLMRWNAKTQVTFWEYPVSILSI